MAKSIRSKWKKAHRRQKTAAEAKNVGRRLRQLNQKLKLTAKGGISAVPPQTPERRYHFLNPELDPRVPNTSKNLNNNYRSELNHISYDYSKPLRLPLPTTNFRGKSDPDAPHPLTVHYETIDADAPVAGHALTKADMERMSAKQHELQALASRLEGNEEEEAVVLKPLSGSVKVGKGKSTSNKREKGTGENGVGIVNFDNDPALMSGGGDEPEEFVLSLGDAKPKKVGRGASGGQASPTSTRAEHRIPSMTSQVTRGAKVVATAGHKKVKKLTSASVKATRMVSSTGKKGKAAKMVL